MLTIKQTEIVIQDSSKSTGISGTMEGDNTMEKVWGFSVLIRIFFFGGVKSLRSLRAGIDETWHYLAV